VAVGIWIAGTAPACAQAQADARVQADANDAALVRTALRAAAGDDLATVQALRLRTKDALARRLIAWIALTHRNGQGDFAEIVGFGHDRKPWPLFELVERSADRSITSRTPADLLLAWFADRVPHSAEGLLNAHAALVAQGKSDAADDLLRRTWSRVPLTHGDEGEILKRLGAQLRPEDHADRIHHLVAHGRSAHARVLIARLALEKFRNATAELRLQLQDAALARRPGAVDAAIANLSDTERKKEGLLYDLFRLHLRDGRLDDAHAIAMGLPGQLRYARRWWSEFDQFIRAGIATGQLHTAYDLARHHRQGEPRARAEAEFFAGFIAFRLLKRRDLAEQHFAAAGREKLTGWSTARLAYWMARVAEVDGDQARAEALFALAAKHSTSYYGLLAASRLGRTVLSFDTASPADAIGTAFWSDDMVRAAHLLRAAGDAKSARLFAARIAWYGGRSVAEHAYLAKFVIDLPAPEGGIAGAVRMQRLAARDGAAINGYGYPTLELPPTNAIEPALVHAIIRQESEFVTWARSHAGARGLMQLMPRTAENEAAAAALPFALERLTADPAYNLRLGTRHLERLRNYYGGAYPLMIAAYNAGITRVNLWLAQYGDPRHGKIDWVDWIELIPYEETRLYTQYVLENHALYRLELGDVLDLPRLTAHWHAPPPDKAHCRRLARVAEEAEAARQLAGPKTESGENESDKHAPEAKKRPAVAKKDKPDNRPGRC
jgi:soluble lytic murein transglycosylase